MSRKKILQLRSSIGFFGAENVIAELTSELVPTEYQPIIGVFRNKKNPHLELVDFARKKNIESAIFDCQREFDLKTILSIRNFIRKNNIDIVQTHGYKSNFYALCATLFENIPLIATCHPWIKNSRRIKIYAKIDKFLLKKFDRIVAISEEVKQEISQAGIDNNKISIIDNGINIEVHNSNIVINIYKLKEILIYNTMLILTFLYIFLNLCLFYLIYLIFFHHSFYTPML